MNTVKNKSVVTTLYEGHYDYGVGGLLNSLANSGFEGIFCIGYKGNSPFWIAQLTVLSNEENLYRLNKNILVRLDKLDAGMHFGYYKPFYLEQMKSLYTEARGFYYFDPDIIVLGKWTFFETWIQSGVALCQDIFYQFLHVNHPWRSVWRADFPKFDEGINENWNYYINSGFIGVTLANFKIIDRWVEVTKKYKELGYPIDHFNQSDALGAYKGDQDVLNAVLTLTKAIPLSPLSKDAMGFEFPFVLMAHAVDGGGVKPWKRNYIKHALDGRKPSITDEVFLDHCETPIRIYSSQELKRKKRLLKISKIINRIWKR